MINKIACVEYFEGLKALQKCRGFVIVECDPKVTSMNGSKIMWANSSPCRLSLQPPKPPQMREVVAGGAGKDLPDWGDGVAVSNRGIQDSSCCGC